MVASLDAASDADSSSFISLYRLFGSISNCFYGRNLSVGKEGMSQILLTVNFSSFNYPSL